MELKIKVTSEPAIQYVRMCKQQSLKWNATHALSIIHTYIHATILYCSS